MVSAFLFYGDLFAPASAEGGALLCLLFIVALHGDFFFIRLHLPRLIDEQNRVEFMIKEQKM